MWIKKRLASLKDLWRDKSYRRVLYALGLSLVLHFYVIGQLYLNWPDQKKQAQVIEARLVIPEKLAATEAKAVATESVSIEAPKPKKIKPVKALPAQIAPENVADNTPIVNTPTATAPIKVTPERVEQELPDTTPELVAENNPDENLTEDTELSSEGLIVNHNTYRYVETRFDVYTDKEPALGSGAAGEAKIIYQQLPDSAQYHIKSMIQAKGLAAVFVPDLLQTSEGEIVEAGLQPKHYLYQFGNKKNKTYRADFDWPAKKLNLHHIKGGQTLDLVEGTQDLLSFMYQFMFLQPLQNMQLNVTNGRKIGVYTYSFEGEVTISTKLGEINTIHLSRERAEGEKKTELWLALDYQYVPVKIRETEKDGKVYELIVSDLKTEPN